MATTFSAMGPTHIAFGDSEANVALGGGNPFARMVATDGALTLTSGTGGVDPVTLTGVADPTQNEHAANKGYVDTAVAGAGGATVVNGTANEITVDGGDTIKIADDFSKSFTSATLGVGADATFNLCTGAVTNTLNIGTGGGSTDIRTITIGTVNGTGSSLTLKGGEGTGAFNLDLTTLNTTKSTISLRNTMTDALSITAGGISYLKFDTDASRVVTAVDHYANQHYNTSDARLKDNVTTVERGLDMVAKMRGVTWDWKPEMTVSARASCGIVAQELNEILPCAISQDKDETGLMRVNYNALSGVFIEAIKDLKAQVEALQADKQTSPESVTARRYNMRRRLQQQ